MQLITYDITSNRNREGWESNMQGKVRKVEREKSRVLQECLLRYIWWF